MRGVELREKSIRIVFRYNGKQCKETLHLGGAPLAPTPANAKYAGRLASEVIRQINAGTFDYAATFPESKNAPKPAGLTGDELFFDLIDRWWSLLELKPSTKKNYGQQKENFWKVHLPNKPIRQFVHSDIKGALKQGTWKSNKSRNNQLSIIRGVFELAVLDRQIKENPCDGLEYSTVQAAGPDPFSLEEVAQILKALAEDTPAQSVNYLEFMFFSGCRTSEGIAIEWSNVDLNKGEIKIDSVLVYEEEQESTKTNTARIVKLPDQALAAIRRQMQYTYAAGGKVFHDPYYDAPWLYQRITDVPYWPRVLKKLGIRHRRMYNTRHTYATIGLMAGANPAFMAKQLGHSLEMFFKVYSKWIGGKQDDEEMAKIQQAIYRKIPKQSPDSLQVGQ